MGTKRVPKRGRTIRSAPIKHATLLVIIKLLDEDFNQGKLDIVFGDIN